jgi:hypothetical protein
MQEWGHSALLHRYVLVSSPESETQNGFSVTGSPSLLSGDRFLVSGSGSRLRSPAPPLPLAAGKHMLGCARLSLPRAGPRNRADAQSQAQV